MKHKKNEYKNLHVMLVLANIDQQEKVVNNVCFKYLKILYSEF